MAFLFKLITVAAIATVASSRTVGPDTTQTADSYAAIPQPSYFANPTEDSYAAPAVNLQLPKVDASNVPFFAPEPSTVLKAPQFFANPEPNYYEVPVPSQDLRAPAETAWNPDNDPKFYYEIPAILTKQQLPTNEYPKKYNKEIHTKEKPFAGRPKEEIAILPIDEKQYLAKQKSLNKAYLNLAKKENQKLLQAEKSQQAL